MASSIPSFFDSHKILSILTFSHFTVYEIWCTVFGPFLGKVGLIEWRGMRSGWFVIFSRFSVGRWRWVRWELWVDLGEVWLHLWYFWLKLASIWAYLWLSRQSSRYTQSKPLSSLPPYHSHVFDSCRSSRFYNFWGGDLRFRSRLEQELGWWYFGWV